MLWVWSNGAQDSYVSKKTALVATYEDIEGDIEAEEIDYTPIEYQALITHGIHPDTIGKPL